MRVTCMWRLGVLVLAAISAAASTAGAADKYPELEKGKEIEKGIWCTDVTLVRGTVPMKLWVYLPSAAPAAKFPCVLIAPAGSRMFHGMQFVEEDRREHLPYVRAGFAVVGYEVDGPLPDRPTNAQGAAAVAAFRNAGAGVENAKAALNYAIAKIPQIDTKRFYAVGHSSAATLALQVAESEPRIAACVAFAPIGNVPQHIKAAGPALEKLQPGTMAFLLKISPDQNLERLKCPTMIFSALDDENVPNAQVVAFGKELAKRNQQVKLLIAKDGGHYDAMINEGIPTAIEWLKGLRGIAPTQPK